MTSRNALRLLAAASLLSGAAGCSRSYDGSIVPTYEVGTDRLAGIPYLTLKQTPLDPPNMRGIAVPARANVSRDGFDTTERAAPARPRATPARSARRARERTPAARPAPAEPLQCRDADPGPRLVRIVCE